MHFDDGDDGKFIDERGYLRFSDSGKLVHRSVAEKQLGRKLEKDEVVHHNNRKKLDNRPQNLTVFASQDEHQAEHEAAGDFTDENFWRW
jgi:hypothetical protein